MNILTRILITVTIPLSAFADKEFISGIQPDQRPNAPVIKRAKKLRPKNALHGISTPIPTSLSKTIRSQGAWYTPLTRSGMTGPYDLRGYHTPADTALAESYHNKQWDPIHFKTALDKATDSQCLACHQEIMTHKVLKQSQAGVAARKVKAWYQTLDTYQGSQEDFHWRHLQSPFAQRVTQFRCTTCHQGNDPREEAWVPESKDLTKPFTLRKGVNPKTCLMCHGQFPDPKIMNLPAPWSQIRDAFQNNCLSCHVAFRTNRHNVNFLKPEAIEEAGRESGDSCYGCHGGRAWYRISYPYPRHAWPNMSSETPEWAKDRMTESEARFLEKYIDEKGN